MDFQTRLSKLNKNQLSAVQELSQNLLVIAGPGTGKTELLGMRAANILDKTDTQPSSILCLTFTDNASANMRDRLKQIIGESAYKIAIHTFHSFGVEIINQNREFFFQGSDFKPADEIARFQTIRQLFEELEYSHPLAAKFYDEFVHQRAVSSMITEFKKSGLTPEQLKSVVASNQKVISQLNPDISEIFANRISSHTIPQFAELALKASTIQQNSLPVGVASYAEIIASSIASASSEAINSGKTNSITAWKNAWCKKDVRKNTVLNDSQNVDKLLAAIELYEKYNQAMREKMLYDYDDMILNVIKAVEKHPDLMANIQEKFQYIMVDEFQDTNLAQLRLLFSIANKESTNVMVVGDDDQAIYSFQGADIGNIQRFREHFDDPKVIILTDNYRSTKDILDISRSVITRGENRLENSIEDLSKELTPWFTSTNTKVEIHEYQTPDEEKTCLTKNISSLINQGTQPEDIAVLARKHYQLVELLPYFSLEGLSVNYEKRDDALDHEVVKSLEKLARVVLSIRSNNQDLANSLLPEIIAHPAFSYHARDIWKLSLSAYRNRSFWLENMLANPTFKSLADWLIDISYAKSEEPLEAQLDHLLGIQTSENIPTLYNYYFSTDNLANNPSTYLDALEALRTIRDKIREHFVTITPTLDNFVSFIDLYHEMGERLMTVRRRVNHQKGQVNLLSTHGAKGLEFKHVFIINTTDSQWGENAKSKSRSIKYPANLPLEQASGGYDEQIRLFFVAMTRARQTLNISYSATTESNKKDLLASFLSDQRVTKHPGEEGINATVQALEIDWRTRLASPITPELKSLIAPKLEDYKLSATHLNNFLNVSKGGPQVFLLNNLLQFPQARTPQANYGTAIHQALQYVHSLMVIDGKLPTIDSIVEKFQQHLAGLGLSEKDFVELSTRGSSALNIFIQTKEKSFKQNQTTELNLASQGVVIGDAKLTGKLDLIEIDAKKQEIFVTDYKTGKPVRDWKGSSDYEKVKLHQYRQQLMFYQLLLANSRNYAKYRWTGGRLQFVEPERGTNDILSLESEFIQDELEEFKLLINAVYQKIISLDLPAIEQYPKDINGIKLFEKDLIDGIK